MSTLAREVLPDLSRRHEITYVTAGEEVPRGEFARVIRGRRRRHMNVAGFDLSRRVNRLYRDGEIDLAMVWASIGFALRRVPFINLEGTSVYAQIGLFSSRAPALRRMRFLSGLVHYALPEMLCNRRAVKIIVPSQALKRDIVRLHGVPDGRVAVVPHGVEPGHLRCYERKRPAPRTTLLFVGRLHFGKGIAEALEEFARRGDIEADFVVVGDGPDRPRVERTAAADGRVKLLGELGHGDLESLLPTTRVFVLPTYYEGFGLSLLEAMASGHACVCYDVPAVREVLGDAGILVPLGDVRALVDAVAGLARDEEAMVSLARRAHERAARFSWEDAVTAIDRVIREAAPTRRLPVAGPAALRRTSIP
ncbi:MAG: glycosyltransferase family 4 protein [Acidobacteria bacterium]|nr:glycosyltransferase family 4 protein [Acidobacteriota bacterium]